MQILESLITKYCGLCGKDIEYYETQKWKPIFFYAMSKLINLTLGFRRQQMGLGLKKSNSLMCKAELILP